MAVLRLLALVRSAVLLPLLGRETAMSERTCGLLVVNLTGLTLWLHADNPTEAGLGAVLVLFAVWMLVKDRITDEIARRRP